LVIFIFISASRPLLQERQEIQSSAPFRLY
jgi:hypothetical protein